MEVVLDQYLQNSLNILTTNGWDKGNYIIYIYNTHQLNFIFHFIPTCKNTVVGLLLNVWPYCFSIFITKTALTDLVHTTKDDRSSKCFWNINPCNLHYLYAYLHGFGEWSARIFCCKVDSIGLVVKHTRTVIKNGDEIWTKVCVGVEKRGSYIELQEYVTAAKLF